VLVVVGLNQRNASVADRELLAGPPREVPPREVEADLAGFGSLGGIEEVAVLASSYRAEIYAATRCPAAAVAALSHALNARVGRELPLFQLQGEEAFRHLARVASSLDSAILGESQILGQVTEAFEGALASGAAGPELTGHLGRALEVADRVRRETAIGRSGASWGHAAVALVEKVIGPVEGKRVVVVGAGETVRVSAQHLGERGALITVIDEPGAGRAPSLQEELLRADVVVCAAPVAREAFRPAAMARLMAARRRPIVLIDLAAPRAIPEESGHLRDVYLCDVEDLERVMRASLDERAAAVASAERIVDAEVLRWTRDEAARACQASARPHRAAPDGDEEALGADHSHAA
jgi:glutamyl-tRNA reductase